MPSVNFPTIEKTTCLAGLLLLAGTLLIAPLLFAADREVAIVNGSPVAENQYPALTALMSGREASIFVNNQQLAGQYFGHGVKGAFSGSLIGCGYARDECQNVAGNVCLIVTTPGNEADALTPAQQLNNCSLGGGTGALFRTNETILPRTDLFDGDANIPAVFISDLWSRAALNSALSTGSVQINVEPRSSDTILCGAAYLGNQWLITAAHCVHQQTPDGVRLKKPWEVQAIVGAYNLYRDNRYVQTISEIRVRNFQAQGVGSTNDLALLKLTDPIRTSLSETLRAKNLADAAIVGINIADAATTNKQSIGSNEALVLGWGSTSAREPLRESPVANTTSNVLLSAVLTLNPIPQCKQQWRDFLRSNNISPTAAVINNDHLCAYDPINRSDTCQGDSGGPLFIEVDGTLELAGITSFGLGCSSGVPGVYTRVSSYKSWIEQVTGIEPPSEVVVVPTGQPIQGGPPSFVGGGSFGFFMLFLVFLKRRALILLLPLLLFACTAQPTSDEGVVNFKAAEQMNSVISKGMLRIQVLSNGCTRSEHFSVNEDSSMQCGVVVNRIQPDLCKMATHSVHLDLAVPTLSNCKPSDIKVLNPAL